VDGVLGRVGLIGKEMERMAAPPNLARALHDAWAQAPEGDVVVRVHLFGITHSEALEGVNLRELVAAAEIPKPYATEIRKGMRLADYVTLK
jgi:hypothetical protein